MVVDAHGKRIANVPVASTLADGTQIQGMRGVEMSGWHSDSKLFAKGTVSPSVTEYSVIAISGEEEPSEYG